MNLCLKEVQRRIEHSTQKNQKAGSEVQLIAVSKRQPIDKVLDLIQSGQSHFAENYVQEFLKKYEVLKSEEIKWHFIGHIQTNKLKSILGKCHRIHSIDSMKILESLNELGEGLKIPSNILLQLNLAQEESKGGLTAEQLRENWAMIEKMRGVRVCGLMTMPPLQNHAEQNRPYFAELRRLLQGLKSGSAQTFHPLNELSMGTSHDFEIAIEEGATWVRLGTILFGARQ